MTGMAESCSPKGKYLLLYILEEIRMDTEQEFVKWATRYKYRLDMDDKGYYTSTHTQSAWDAWRGADEIWKTLISSGHSTQRK